MLLKTVDVGADGRFETEVTIPADATRGRHVLVLREVGGREVRQRILITDQSAGN
jgi:hypothetical protein